MQVHSQWRVGPFARGTPGRVQHGIVDAGAQGIVGNMHLLRRHAGINGTTLEGAKGSHGPPIEFSGVGLMRGVADPGQKMQQRRCRRDQGRAWRYDRLGTGANRGSHGGPNQTRLVRIGFFAKIRRIARGKRAPASRPRPDHNTFVPRRLGARVFTHPSPPYSRPPIVSFKLVSPPSQGRAAEVRLTSRRRTIRPTRTQCPLRAIIGRKF
jgi:hypothetical protein